MWFAKPLRVAPGGGGGGCGGCLTHLSLGNGRGVTGDLSSLSGHASCLRSVNLGGCAGVAGRLASLQECAELAVLNLNGCGAVRKIDNTIKRKSNKRDRENARKKARWVGKESRGES
jgi:hypothetical protein